MKRKDDVLDSINEEISKLLNTEQKACIWIVLESSRCLNFKVETRLSRPRDT